METRKTALVTGAAKGIGRQIAYCMAEAGCNVIVNYHSNKAAAEELCREMEKFGVQTMTVYADMGKVSDIEEMYRQVFEVFPVVDVLVNNAGISSEVIPAVYAKRLQMAYEIGMTPSEYRSSWKEEVSGS